jgi:hypothetical protein
MDENEIIEQVLRRARDVGGKKQISCADALDLAGRFDSPPAEIGRICNENDIRIRSCQLGCFK